MNNRLTRIFALCFALLVPLSMHAEVGANTSTQDTFTFNPLLIGLLSLMLVLLFAIGVIANALRQLVFVYRDKFWAKKNLQNGKNIVLFLIAFGLPTLHALATEPTSAAAAVVTPVSNLVDGIPLEQFYVLLSVIMLELFVVIALSLFIKVMVGLLSDKPELAPVAKAVLRKSFFWDKFNNAVTIEKEKDILLDHDYDGIKELDNSLPPWWKYGFILTIIIAGIYLYRYQVSGVGPNPQQEYAEEVRQGEEDKAAYLAKSADKVDENSVKQLTAQADIAAGEQIFQTTCFPCHAKDGGGGVGPNLTDDYWLHGGSIQDVFKSIKYGWQDKGMKSWKDDFSPKQIAELASFVKSLHGTKPAAPKEKQGELYIEGNNVKSDSTGKVAKN